MSLRKKSPSAEHYFKVIGNLIVRFHWILIISILVIGVVASIGLMLAMHNEQTLFGYIGEAMA